MIRNQIPDDIFTIHTAAPKLHKNCLSSPYCRDANQPREPVTPSQVSWSASYPDYHPTDFTMPHILKGPVWADPHIRTNDEALRKIQFNKLDGKVERRSHHGPYNLDEEESPVNPVGRTGLRGRGTLGRWGPNHAADPIVTRWKRGPRGEKVKHKDTNKPILQFIAIVRRDHGDWAIPGGMIDAGEHVTKTLRREFREEAMNSLELTDEQKEHVSEQVDQLFKTGVPIYRGYVDDPRNTDNAWMETQAFNFHDELGDSVGAFRLNAGDDATGVKWMDITSDLNLFATHSDFMETTAAKHNAHW